MKSRLWDSEDIMAEATTELLPLAEFPGINESLIREYFAEGKVELLVALFSSIQRAKHRAEAERDCFMRMMAKMAQTRGLVARDVADNVRAALPERLPAAPRPPAPSNRTQTPKAKPTRSQAATLDALFGS